MLMNQHVLNKVSLNRNTQEDKVMCGSADENVVTRSLQGLLKNKIQSSKFEELIGFTNDS